VPSFFNPNGWPFVLGESLLIVAFTFLYTAVTFNPVDHADALRKHGGFMPGVRPGRPTATFFFFGGTSLLIVVGVAIETVRQLEAQLAMRSYSTFLKDPTTPPRGRSNLARAGGPESDRGDAHKRRVQTASS
jgi:preprotein translocase subunit SecY